MKQLKQGCKCESCLGCGRLENPDFIGTYNCDAYRQAEKKLTFIDHISKQWEQEKISKEYGG